MKYSLFALFPALVLACPLSPSTCGGQIAEFVSMPPILQPSFEACIYCCDNGAGCSPTLTVDGVGTNVICSDFMCNGTIDTTTGEHVLSFNSGAITATKLVRVVASEPSSVPSIPFVLTLITASIALVKNK